MPLPASRRRSRAARPRSCGRWRVRCASSTVRRWPWDWPVWRRWVLVARLAPRLVRTQTAGHPVSRTGPVLVAVAATVAVVAMDLDVATVGHVPAGLPVFTLPIAAPAVVVGSGAECLADRAGRLRRELHGRGDFGGAPQGASRWQPGIDRPRRCQRRRGPDGRLSGGRQFHPVKRQRCGRRSNTGERAGLRVGHPRDAAGADACLRASPACRACGDRDRVGLDVDRLPLDQAALAVSTAKM